MKAKKGNYIEMKNGCNARYFQGGIAKRWEERIGDLKLTVLGNSVSHGTGYENNRVNISKKLVKIITTIEKIKLCGNFTN